MTESRTADVESAARRLNTLFVSPFGPYPLNFGGAIRLYNLMRVVHEFSEVSLVHLQPWVDTEAIDVLGEFCKEVVPVVRTSHSPARTRMRSIFSSHSFQHLDHRDHEFRHVLDDLTERQRFDVVVTEMTQMASYDVSRASA